MKQTPAYLTFLKSLSILCPATLTDMSGRWKKKSILCSLLIK